METLTYKVVEEYLVLERYRVLKLNHDLTCKGTAKYLINGTVYEPERVHYKTTSGIVPLNLIAIKTTKSFLGATVEFV